MVPDAENYFWAIVSNTQLDGFGKPLSDPRVTRVVNS